MVTLDAWVTMFLLVGMAVVAFSPALAGRVNRCGAARWLERRRGWADTRWYWVLFALALLVGAGVRIWRFPELPRGINQDEAMSAVEALSLLRNGTDQYGTSWPVHFEAWQHGQMSVLLSYLTVPFYALFGVSRLTMRLPMLVVSLVALPVFWDLARRLGGRNLALLALWLLAICPWHIIQSRWSLDADLLPHVLLFAVYFLALGLSRKPFLYLSMVFFGLSMYTYGITLYTVPALLLVLAVYLLWKGRIRWWEMLLCAGVYLLVSAPFLVTMMINFFEWDTIHLGPVTLPRFYETVRYEDILFFSENPYEKLIENIQSFLSATVLQNMGSGLFVYKPTRTLYAFSVPMIFLGAVLLWWRRRRSVLDQGRAHPEQALRQDTALLVLAWLFAACLCGLLTNDSNINRANSTFYPLILCLGVALYGIMRKVRLFAIPIVILYTLGFVVFFQGYFYNEPYIERVGHDLYNDMYGALVEAQDMDCDRYYIDNRMLGGSKAAEMFTALAHEIDARQLQSEEPMYDAQGNELDYYGFRYIYTNFGDFEPDSTECAAYIIHQDLKPLFDLSEYIVTEHDLYALLYPRYWAEE